MQVTIDARNLKPFTRALTCISKYGDEMMVYAGPDGLVLSALNLAKTAYCSFTYRRSFFQRYSAPQSTQSSAAGPSRSNQDASRDGGAASLKCQLQTKALLSVLKHRNTDKTAEKCELTIIDGVDTPEEELRENEDAFESRLIVRLHCKHGIIKTHRLLLNTPTNDEAPLIPTSEDESRILVQAHAVKEIIEHFPSSKSAKSDPEIIWSFNEDEVRVKSMEKGIDAKGKSQLATELKLGADEFDLYSVPTAPMTLGFFLREFNATVTLADALSTPIDIRFTTSVQPICISAESDGCNMLFIIATNPARGEDGGQRRAGVRKSQSNGNANGNHGSISGVAAARKRTLEDDARGEGSIRRRTVPPGKAATQQNLSNGDFNFNDATNADPYDPYEAGPGQTQPLFLSTQLSAADVEMLRDSGLGIENMDAEEFAAMLDGEGEEVGDAGAQAGPVNSGTEETDDLLESRSVSVGDEMERDELEDDAEMGPTQLENRIPPSSEKAFYPLFED